MKFKFGGIIPAITYLFIFQLITSCKTSVNVELKNDNIDHSQKDQPSVNQPENSTPISLSFLFPTKQAHPTGHKLLVKGTCTSAVGDVTIRADINATSTEEQTSCTSDQFSAFINTSTLSAGEGTLYISQTNEINTTVNETLSIKKHTTQCNLSTDRVKDFVSGLAGGTGTESDPYIICTPEQLAEVENASGSDHFILGNDIYFEDPDTNGDFVHQVGVDIDYTTGAGWSPITRTVSSFHGMNHAITNLTINRPSTDYIGLFRDVNSVSFKDINFYDSNIIGSMNTGTLAGRTRGINININCYHCNVTGEDQTAAVIGGKYSGVSYGGEVLNANITGNDYVGGYIGQGYDFQIYNAKVTGVIVGNNYVGGISGDGNGIYDSYSDINITANSYAGGIQGSNGDRVYRSYSQGEVSTINNNSACISNGPVFNSIGACSSVTTGSNNAAFITNNSTVSGNYFSDQLVCIDGADSTCNDSSGNDLSDTVSNLKDPTHPVYSTWDFRSNSTDGESEIWVSYEDNFPQLYFEVKNSFSSSLSGSGTIGDPYLISSLGDLLHVDSNPFYSDKHFRLTTNIDMSSITPGSLKPLFSHYPFSGSFNGDGFKISGLDIYFPNDPNIGFFSVMANGGHVYNLHLAYTRLEGSRRVGGVAGMRFSSDGECSNLMTSGTTLTAGSYSGGLFGTFGGILRESTSSLNQVCGYRCGGLIGSAGGGQLYDSFYAGNLNSSNGEIGGIVGVNTTGFSITRTYSLGNYSTTSTGGAIGGLGGANYDSNTNSFSLANISGVDNDGSNGIHIGYLFGINGVTSSYYLANQVSCINSGTGGACNTTGTEADAAAVDISYFYNSSNPPLSTWDFTNTWDNSGDSTLPTLRNLPSL